MSALWPPEPDGKRLTVLSQTTRPEPPVVAMFLPKIARHQRRLRHGVKASVSRGEDCLRRLRPFGGWRRDVEILMARFKHGDDFCVAALVQLCKCIPFIPRPRWKEADSFVPEDQSTIGSMSSFGTRPQLPYPKWIPRQSRYGSNSHLTTITFASGSHLLGHGPAFYLFIYIYIYIYKWESLEGHGKNTLFVPALPDLPDLPDLIPIPVASLVLGIPSPSQQTFFQHHGNPKHDFDFDTSDEFRQWVESKKEEIGLFGQPAVAPFDQREEVRSRASPPLFSGGKSTIARAGATVLSCEYPNFTCGSLFGW